MKKTGFLLLLLFVTVCLWPSASGEGAEAGFHFDWFGFFGRVFNSVVLFGGLIVILRKPLIEFLAGAGRSVANDIREREKRIADGTLNLENVNLRLSRIEDEIEGMKKAGEDGGRAEMVKLEETGRRETDRILALSETEINLRIESALKQLREKIADLTIDHFQKEIRQNLTAEIQGKIVDRNIERIGELDERK